MVMVFYLGSVDRTMMLIMHKGDDFSLQLSNFVRQGRLALPFLIVDYEL
jgi:hypothetical protein